MLYQFFSLLGTFLASNTQLGITHSKTLR